MRATVVVKRENNANSPFDCAYSQIYYKGGQSTKIIYKVSATIILFYGSSKRIELNTRMYIQINRIVSATIPLANQLNEMRGMIACRSIGLSAQQIRSMALVVNLNRLKRQRNRFLRWRFRKS